jgi:hypothetical protein
VHIEFTDDTTFSACLKALLSIEAKCIQDFDGEPQVLKDYTTSAENVASALQPLFSSQPVGCRLHRPIVDSGFDIMRRTFNGTRCGVI